MLKRAMVVDFEQFFRFFDFSSDDLLKYLQHYCQSSNNLRKKPEELLAELEKQLKKRKKTA